MITPRNLVSLLVLGAIILPSTTQAVPRDLPSYGGLTSVSSPHLEAFRQYDILFTFSVDSVDVNEKLYGTDWEVGSPSVAMTVGWAFQSFVDLSGGGSEQLIGPTSSVTFSFTARHVVTGESRRLAWALHADEEDVDRLNAVLGGGNAVGEMQFELEDEEGILKFRGRVRTQFGLDLRATATLPNRAGLAFRHGDPFALKVSFIDWSTEPATIHSPFTLAEQFYQTAYSTVVPGFTAQLTTDNSVLPIPGGANEFTGFVFKGSVLNRMNRYFVLGND